MANSPLPPEELEGRRKKRASVNYVDPEKFTADMLSYKEKVNAARAAGQPLPRLSEYSGECILKIAYHSASRKEFLNKYSYIQEMIDDAIEDCIKYAHNYNPEKGLPFSYFSQIVYYAFIGRIQKEKKEFVKRYRYRQKLQVEHGFETIDQELGETFGVNQPSGDGDYVREFVESFEASLEKKREEKRKRKAEAAAALVSETQLAEGEEVGPEDDSYPAEEIAQLECFLSEQED